MLFRPFVQGPNAHGGLGVGLSVAYGLVALHQGTIHALERGERGGATVVVMLPVIATPAGS
jgi:signal transduction histidine kinase